MIIIILKIMRGVKWLGYGKRGVIVLIELIKIGVRYF
jgi:hypothetical protein